MRPFVRSSIFAFGIGVGVFGCSLVDPNADESSSAATEADDIALARKAFSLVAGTSAHCNSCHTAGKDDMRRWADAMTTIDTQCLAPTLALTAAQRIACLKNDPAETRPAMLNANFNAERLGLYAAGASTTAITQLFKDAYGDTWQDEYNTFKRFAGMPASSTAAAFTDAEFATVKQWALSGLPRIDEVMAEPGASDCVPGITPAFAAHMDKMKQEGWGARLAAASVPMAGCGAALDARECLGTYPDLTAQWGYAGTRQTLRQLRKLSFRSSYWVRSSPDGRYSAFGGSSRILDVTAGDADQGVSVDAPYDPGFFPNNDGFSYASAGGGGIRVCKQSVLLNALAGNHHVTFNEPGCSKIIDTVYQSVGAALDGSLFFMATGTHTNDAGGNSGPLSASFGQSATTTLSPMYNDGTKYVPGANVQVSVPFEGDQQMSASNTLLITRFGSTPTTAGYHVRRVTPTFGSPGGGPTSSLTVSTELYGTACIAGGKPQLSFDERFLVVHQYTDSNHNPQGLPAGTSNIFLVDMKTGRQEQLTKVAAGQRALYPHFRADGWIYFLVRDNNGSEIFVGSDAALQMAAAN